MDINEFMKRSLAAQEKTNELLSKLVEQGEKVVNIDMRVPAEVKQGLEAAKEASKPAAEFNPESDETQAIPRDVMLDALDRAAAAKAEEKPEVVASKDLQPVAKKITVDDARGVLKAFAAREGNDAAMELLTSLGATSVSSLAEQGNEKLAELIAKCLEAA